MLGCSLLLFCYEDFYSKMSKSTGGGGLRNDK